MEYTPKLETIDQTYTMQEEVEFEVDQEEQLISLDAFSNTLSSETLKLLGCIKHYKVVVLVNSGNTHNFIHQWEAK